MPVSNHSLIWPKMLVCKKCKEPVEDSVIREKRQDPYQYECQNCGINVTAEQTEWVAESHG